MRTPFGHCQRRNSFLHHLSIGPYKLHLKPYAIEIHGRRRWIYKLRKVNDSSASIKGGSSISHSQIRQLTPVYLDLGDGLDLAPLADPTLFHHFPSIKELVEPLFAILTPYH